MINWCEKSSGRDAASCACILGAVEEALQPADYIVLAEVAETALAEGATEEAIEAAFNEKYGAERMTALMQTFVSKRREAEKTCPESAKAAQEPQGS